ncbi:MAG TPA: hypothetical protein V6D25_08330 [Leptolyngbyaceae cyanobacterium]
MPSQVCCDDALPRLVAIAWVERASETGKPALTNQKRSPPLR